MHRLIINHFEQKNQDRLRFVQVLNDTLNIGLKKSKMLMDAMIDGQPIEVEVNEDLIANFEKNLKELNLNFLILPTA